MSSLGCQSLGLYKTCLAVALSLSSPDVTLLRSLYEKAVASFGDGEVDLWLDYVRFEFAQGRHHEAA